MKSLKSLDSTPVGRFLILFTVGVTYYLILRLTDLPRVWILNKLFGIDVHPSPWWSPWVLGPAVVLLPPCLFAATSWKKLTALGAVGRLTIVGGVREVLLVWRRGRLGTVCARGATPALLCGPSTSPLDAW